MSEDPLLATKSGEPEWVTELGKKRPDWVLMAPFMVYLILLGFNDWVPKAYMPFMIALRGLGGLWVFWIFRRHFPPLGKPHVLLAIVCGVLVAAGWVAGRHFFNGITFGSKSLGGSLFNWLELSEVKDPREGLSPFSWWSQVVLRISVASVTVPIVEELFWRAFLLRALINWDRFEEIPLGKFTWFSFLGTSLLSTLEHPANWGVSIFCWFAYNGLMYWKKSILFLIITHGVTNLALYIYVILAEDWLFW